MKATKQLKLITGGIFFLLTACGSAKLKDTKVETILKTSDSWNGNQFPNYPEGVPEITILKITIPPKSSLELHKHSVINAGIITKGELMVVTDQKDTLYLKEDDAIAEVVETWHYGTNTGSRPTEIIVFYAGVEGMPNTILKSDKSN